MGMKIHYKDRSTHEPCCKCGDAIEKVIYDPELNGKRFCKPCFDSYVMGIKDVSPNGIPDAYA